MRFLADRQTDLDLSTAELKRLLVEDRKSIIALYTKSNFASSQPLIRRNTDNWVRTWVDREHRFFHPDGKRVAHRAITDSGQLIWMVETKGRRFAFHADALNVDDAFAQAEKARLARRAIARRWNEVKVLRRQVLLGTVRLTPSLDDARDAGLCELGIQGFLNSIGYGGKTHVPGRLLMLISFFDRQVAYAVFAAHANQNKQRQTV